MAQEEDPKCLNCGKSTNILKNQRSNIAIKPFCAFSSCYAKYVYYEQTFRQAFENLAKNYPQQIEILRNEFVNQYYEENFDRLVSYAHDWIKENNPQEISILCKALNKIQINTPAIAN